MADIGYNPMQQKLKNMDFELKQAEKINREHQQINGKLRVENRNLAALNKKLKNKILELEEKMKGENNEQETNNTDTGREQDNSKDES